MKGDVLLRHPERHGCTNPPWVTSLLKNPKYPPYRILPAEFPKTQTSVRNAVFGMSDEWWRSLAGDSRPFRDHPLETANAWCLVG